MIELTSVVDDVMDDTGDDGARWGSINRLLDLITDRVFGESMNLYVNLLRSTFSKTSFPSVSYTHLTLPTILLV